MGPGMPTTSESLPWKFAGLKVRHLKAESVAESSPWACAPVAAARAMALVRRMLRDPSMRVEWDGWGMTDGWEPFPSGTLARVEPLSGGPLPADACDDDGPVRTVGAEA